jgi:hypothetical protein
MRECEILIELYCTMFSRRHFDTIDSMGQKNYQEGAPELPYWNSKRLGQEIL